MSVKLEGGGYNLTFNFEGDIAEVRGVIQGLRMAAEFAHSTCAWTAKKMCLEEAEHLERKMKEIK